MKQIEVVAAIIRKGDKIFATQRGYGEWKDWWEFPGGKMEAGETPKEALKREIREELSTEISVDELLCTVEYDYPKFHLTMHCYLCSLLTEALHLNVLKRKEENEKAAAAAQPAKPIKENIQFPEFEKLDIRVGTVLECIKVPKSDKLLQFKIDDGLGGRTILSGIANYYNPENLVGKQVCFIANLAPRKILGRESQGMILSALDADGTLAVTTVQRPVKPGSEVC